MVVTNPISCPHSLRRRRAVAMPAADHNGTVHEYTYDVLGRLLADEVTKLGTGVDGAVRKLSYSFNTQGLPLAFTSRDGGGDVLNQVQRAYDGLGQLTAGNSKGSVSMPRRLRVSTGGVFALHRESPRPNQPYKDSHNNWTSLGGADQSG